MGLIIADEEFNRGASRIHGMSEELTEIMNSFCKVIDGLLTEGICDVSVNQVLAEKSATLHSYAEILSGITDNIVENTKCFITELDEADSYISD